MAGGAMRRRGIIAEINVTPLVDIMLVLLIIFMLTAHLIAKQGIQIELPKAAPTAALPPTMLAITLKADGSIFLNDQPTTPAALRDAIKAAVAKDPKTVAVVAGDKHVSHGRIVWVLDTVNSLGITQFSIQIDPSQIIAPGDGA